MTPQATTPSTNGIARLPIDEAARLLGISRATVRRRLRSGGLTGAQVTTPHGRKWLVELPAATLGTQGCADGGSVTPQGVANATVAGAPPPGRPGPAVANETAAREVELLQAHVDDLRRQLEDRAREVQQLHTLLAQAQARLPKETQVSTLGESPGAQTQNVDRGQHNAPRAGWPEGRRWWQRLLWG